jgi:monofunctional biosynthetic peptidoglycan transglycosylase
VRKGLEAVYTFIIEKVWSKDIILERYLNSIEMGQGVFGVEAAAQYYFGKPSKDLNTSEAAWIAAVLPNPKKYDPKNPSAYLRKKHNWIMRQMRNVSLK